MRDRYEEMQSSPKVLTQLKRNGGEETADGEEETVQSMATDLITQVEGVVATDISYGSVLPLHCLESGDGNEYSMMAVLQSDGSKRPYCPSVESRQLHNHKERLRRSRMKCSCDALRALVPGLTDKTDKATVLEHTVAFLFHLSKCSGVKCDDYLPTCPPPMSAKLLELYPTLMSGEYQYYESIPSADPDFESNESHIIEVRETNGTQYVITSDGSQYMVVDNTEAESSTPLELPSQPMVVSEDNEPKAEEITVDESSAPKDEPMETTADECQPSATQLVDMLSDDKENIDPNALQNANPVRKKRAYRKRKVRETSKKSSPNGCGRATVPPTDALTPSQTVAKVRKQRKVRQKAV